jgi:hypothetical protein
VSIVIEMQSTAEEVRVVEKAPIVSTTKTNVKEVFDEEFIDDLPTGIDTDSKENRAS